MPPIRKDNNKGSSSAFWDIDGFKRSKTHPNQIIPSSIKYLVEVMFSLEDQFKLGRGFLLELREENDWSFIIKVHALIEGTVSNCLSTSIDKRLSNIFNTLELSDSRIGKAQFAEALGIINKDQKNYIRKLSELRNLAVHNIGQAKLNLQTHLQSLDQNQRKAIIESVTQLFAPSIREKWRSDCNKDIKAALWLASMMLIAKVSGAANIIDAKNKLMHMSWKYIETIRKTKGAIDSEAKQAEST